MSQVNQNNKERYNDVNETQVSGLGVTSNKCPVAEQHRVARHQVTAQRNGTEDFNFAVMECDF